jgi:hypothetical protein
MGGDRSKNENHSRFVRRYAQAMCAQCAATGAVTATAAATGARVWLAAKAPGWLTEGRKRALGGIAIAAGVAAAGLLA